MIFDKENLFCENQAITADAPSTNVIDLGQPGKPAGHLGPLIRDIGPGNPIEVWVSVTESFNTLTSLAVGVEVDSDPAFGSPKVVTKTEAVPLASLVAGYRFKELSFVPDGTDERYFRLNFDVTGTAPTTGKVTAGIVAARQTN